jgi:2-keto-4-pentenoate hydratase
MHGTAPRNEIALFFSAFLLLGCSTQAALEDAIVTALSRHEPLPHAHRIDETLTSADAYRVQRRAVKRMVRDAAPAGFKAGLTSAQSQARFNTHEPIAGVLVHEPAATPALLRLDALRGLHIETEVALRVRAPIRQRLDSIASLRTHIDAVAPAIELPNLDYETPQAITALDIIATNAAAAYYIVGEFVAHAERDPNEVAATLICNGHELSRGTGRDALGDQWAAALWLVNTMIDTGWTIEPGQILLTGALGKMVPAPQGSCVADFGAWGRIELPPIQ